jgi:anti-anti-sigma factor
MDGGDAQPLTIVAAGRSLSLIGEADRDSSDQLMRALTRVTDGDSGVCYIDEAGLGVLISETHRRSTRGTTMFVINPSDTERRLFETRGLLEFLHVNEGAADEPQASRQDLGREPDASGRSLRSGLRRPTPRN